MLLIGGIIKALYTQAGIEFILIFNGLLAIVIGLSIFSTAIQIGGIVGVVPKEARHFDSGVTRVQVEQKQRKQKLETTQLRSWKQGFS